MVELKAETDFTAKNDKFVEVTNQLAKLALTSSGETTDEMKSILDDLRISTGENISIGRMEKLEGNGAYGQYIHHDGKTGVLVQASAESSGEVMKQIAMHVAAAHPHPLGLTPDDIPSDLVEKERKFRIEQAVESGKPEQIAEKMVEGGMRKFFSEVALLEQPFIMDQSKKIKELLSGDTTLVAFHRMQIGEGG
ncbi:MAG: translation elongation factor Ts [Phycisphaerales bacterium]|nr:translation elongation factor Ts [Phycisphaerales bacterium]